MAENERKTIHLQGIGQHTAIKASELKPGDITVWNWGGTEKIIAVTPSKSGKTLTATIEYTGIGGQIKRSTRRLDANRLVGIDNISSKKTLKVKPAPTKTAPKATPAKATKPAPVQKSKTTTYTVGNKTFATKKEAAAYKALQKQKAGKPCEIKESTRKPSHRVVSFISKNK